ncbi:MAG: hypothetical protein Q4C60_01940 [Eubacteriales bacterium]|nr:hypothetical protein [Eubacteriales bacterium]
MKDNAVKALLQKSSWINRAVVLWKEREKKVSYGSENPDKTFFVIRRNAPNAGLYSFVLTNLGWIRYALDRGYIPVIDMRSFYNTYMTREQVGQVNSWEYYFKQPCGYRLEDIAGSRHVILSSINAPKDAPLPGVEKDTESLRQWQKLAGERLIASEEAAAQIRKQKECLLQGKRTLGVLCRGTDYVEQRPSQHPVQPAVTDVLCKAEAVMREYHCEQIYLATEDETVYAAFRKHFADRLISYGNRRFAHTGQRNINELSDELVARQKNPEREQYQKGMDYAVTIGLLAECNALVAGRVSGAYGALLQARRYEYVYLFDLGVYE